MTYMNGASTCYQGSSPRFTPVIQNAASRYTVNCQFVTQGTTYTGIYCPSAAVTGIPDGVLTVSYINWAGSGPTPAPYFATFGPSPAPRAVSATIGAVTTSTATRTFTVSPGFASTATVYAAGTTQTYTNTIIVTQTKSTTNTNYVSSCAALISSSSQPPNSPSPSRLPSSSSTATSSAASVLPTPSGG